MNEPNATRCSQETKISNDIRQIATSQFIFSALLLLGCPWKECTSPERGYTAYHTILNMNSIYNLGDTIWITSEMDCKSLQNYITNTVDVFCDAKFSFPLGCVHILDRDQRTFEGGVPKFEFIARKGKVFNDTSIPRPEFNNQVEFTRTGDKYELLLGLVCKTEGYFYISIRPGGAFTKEHCDRASLENLITNIDRDLSIFIDFRYPNEVTDRDQRNIFSFEVQ